MEKFHQMVQEANKYFITADHLAYVTYPVVKEIKLTLTIAQNLYNATEKLTDAIIYRERLYKRISPVPDDFESKADILQKCLKRYNISNDFLLTYRDLKSILKSHRESPVEFIKNNKLVICSNTYSDIKTVDIERLKRHITYTRNALDEVRNIK